MANDVRLIDANAMRQDWLDNGQNEYVYDTNAVLDSIDTQPTIDPESLRPKGRWEYYSTTMQECSACKRHTPRHRYTFCPHCGADMRED